jgi:anti-sigma factor RsiW
MVEMNTHDNHFDDTSLWQWRSQELDTKMATAVEQHLQSCLSCQQRAEAIGRLIKEMQTMHRSVQPTLAEQMQLLRVLEEKSAAVEKSSVLVTTSNRLVRWLAPAVAVLAALFVLLRNETATSTDLSTVLLPETPESRLLIASTDEQLQQAMLELAFSNGENKK